MGQIRHASSITTYVHVQHYNNNNNEKNNNNKNNNTFYLKRPSGTEAQAGACLHETHRHTVLTVTNNTVQLHG